MIFLRATDLFLDIFNQPVIVSTSAGSSVHVSLFTTDLPFTDVANVARR